MSSNNVIEEMVSHPRHYNLPNRKECIVEMEEKYGTFITAVFCLTNAYKYLYRAGTKDGNSREQDISKAKWYFDWVDTKKMPIFEMVNKGSIDEPRDEQLLYLELSNELKEEEENVEVG